MRKKISLNEIENKVNEGKEVVDDYFDVKNAVVGRPRKFISRTEIIKTNLDLTQNMADELDDMAVNLNISRQAVIKMMLRQSLDEHYKAISLKKAS